METLSKGDEEILRQTLDDAIEVSNEFIKHLDEHIFDDDGPDRETVMATQLDANDHLTSLKRIKQALEGGDK
jgi:hypothetical protein